MSIFTDGTRACSCRQHNLTENMLHAALTNSFRKSAQSRLLNRTYDLKRASMVAPMDTATHFRSRAPRSATKEKSEAKPASTATRQNTRTLRDLLPTCGSSCKLRAAPRRTRPLKGRRMPTDPPPHASGEQLLAAGALEQHPQFRGTRPRIPCPSNADANPPLSQRNMLDVWRLAPDAVAPGTSLEIGGRLIISG